MRWGKQKEGWLGVVLTALLCGGFLFWWFRPQAKVWENENASQLVARAVEEPWPEEPVEQQVLDFDLMEVAICQARVGMIDEASATAKHIRHQVIRQRAVIQLATAYLNSDPQDFGRVLALADLMDDPAGRAAVRTEILGQLAVLKFADVAIPEAKSAVQKAILARQLSATDDQSRAKARELMAAAETELPSLPPGDAAAVRESLARARINLTPDDGPDAAIAAIRAVSENQQPALWNELALWCDGGKIDLRKILPLINDADLRRKLEIDSLLFPAKPWPAGELIAKYNAEAAAAATPEAKIEALVSVAEATRNAGEPDNDKAAAAANQILREAKAAVAAISDPVSRCRTFLSLARKLNLALLFDDAKAALTDAIAAARSIEALSARVPQLIATAEESFLQSNADQAQALISEAAAGVSAAKPDAATVQALAVALVRRGDWPRGLTLVAGIPGENDRLAALEAVTEAAADQSMSMDPTDPPVRGDPVDSIRDQAGGDQVRAANLVEKQPAGYARARAWLAMAKGQATAPSKLSDYRPAPETPGELPPPADGGEVPPPLEGPDKAR